MTTKKRVPVRLTKKAGTGTAPGRKGDVTPSHVASPPAHRQPVTLAPKPLCASCGIRHKAEQACDPVQVRQHLPVEDRPMTMPDGGTTTMRKLFPGLYGPRAESLTEARHARRMVPASERYTPPPPGATWPVPCPDDLCRETTTLDDGRVIKWSSGISVDPTAPHQRHHYLCQYWDRTGHTPFDSKSHAGATA